MNLLNLMLALEFRIFNFKIKYIYLYYLLIYNQMLIIKLNFKRETTD